MPSRKPSGRPLPSPGAETPITLVVSGDGHIVRRSTVPGPLPAGEAPAHLRDLAFAGDPYGAVPDALAKAAADCLASGETITLEAAAQGQTYAVTAMPVPSGTDTHVCITLAEEPTSGAGCSDVRASRLVAEMAHELSRPLAAVLNYAEMALLDPELPETVRARLEMVVEQAQQCQVAVRQSLAAGRTTRPFVHGIDLNDVVRRASEACQQVSDDRAVGVSLQLEPELVPVQGDLNDLDSAVRNLIENARHAAREGPGEPEVSLSTENTSAGVRLTVEDSGPGIEPDVAGSLFEPYVTTKPPGVGTGLGLAIVRRIITQHDGQVYADGAANGGARFTIELPSEHRPGGRDQGKPAPGTAGATSKWCLVVDDDPPMRALLRAYLEGLGYLVDEAGNGEQALQEALAREYDLIVCDVKMPALDGPAFHGALAEEYPDRARRVIFSSGVLPTDELDAVLRGLSNPRVQKPFRLAALQAAIERLDRVPSAG